MHSSVLLLQNQEIFLVEMPPPTFQICTMHFQDINHLNFFIFSSNLLHHYLKLHTYKGNVRVDLGTKTGCNMINSSKVINDCSQKLHQYAVIPTRQTVHDKKLKISRYVYRVNIKPQTSLWFKSNQAKDQDGFIKNPTECNNYVIKISYQTNH